MKKEWADKWVAALRSGNYRQGVGSLRDIDDNFCCLGVLCDIVDPSKWNSKKDVIDRYNSTHDYETEGGVLPQSIADVVGMKSIDGNIILREIDKDNFDSDYLDDVGKSEYEIRNYIDNNMKVNVVSEHIEHFANYQTTISLVDLNDSGKFDFLKIADVIETDYNSL